MWTETFCLPIFQSFNTLHGEDEEKQEVEPEGLQHLKQHPPKGRWFSTSWASTGAPLLVKEQKSFHEKNVSHSAHEDQGLKQSTGSQFLESWLGVCFCVLLLGGVAVLGGLTGGLGDFLTKTFLLSALFRRFFRDRPSEAHRAGAQRPGRRPGSDLRGWRADELESSGISGQKRAERGIYFLVLCFGGMFLRTLLKASAKRV